MHLQTIDWVIVVLSLLICFVPALFFGKRAGKGTSEFFASGRSVPWWLAGLSMVATTFSSDTPNLVTDIVRRKGVAGNWCWWAFVLTGVSTVFFYAELWRRSGVMTDLEFYEIRYSGKAASVVRGFRAVYLGFFFNCIIMASVNLAACKIAGILFGLERWQTLLFVGLLNVVFAAHSGLWGVLVIDMIQFFIKMSAVIAAAYFAVKLPAGRRPARHGREALGDAAARRHQLSQHPARLLQPLGHRGGRVRHADRRAVVGRLVSRRRAGRRQLHRPAHAGLEVGEGFAGRRAVLQRRPLLPSPLAVDHSWPSARSSSTRNSPTSRRPFPTSIRACSATTSPIRPC